MKNAEIAMSIMENMGNFHKLMKIVNNERYKMGKVLTERQFFAMISIRNHDKIELKNLSLNLHVSTSSLCILLNKLVEQGYVYREEDSRDRRNTFYGITDKGNEILDKEVEKFVIIISDKVDKISDNESENLLVLLNSLKSVMNKLY